MNTDPGLTCLAMLARLHASPADPAQLRHELGLTEAATAADILRAAQRLKLKAKIGPLSLERAAAGQVPLPAILKRGANHPPIELRQRAQPGDRGELAVGRGGTPGLTMHTNGGGRSLPATVTKGGVRNRC